MLCACPSGKLVDCTHSFVSQTDSLSSLPRCTRATRVLRAILVSNTWRNWPNVNVRSTTDTISSFIPGLLYVSRQCPRAWEWDHITPSLIPRFSLKSLGMRLYHFYPRSQEAGNGVTSLLASFPGSAQGPENETALVQRDNVCYFHFFPQTVQPSATPSVSTPSLITVVFLKSLPLM